MLTITKQPNVNWTGKRLLKITLDTFGVEIISTEKPMVISPFNTKLDCFSMRKNLSPTLEHSIFAFDWTPCKYKKRINSQMQLSLVRVLQI